MGWARVLTTSVFAVGDGANVTVYQHQATPQDEVCALLENFLRSLESHSDAIEDAEGIRESAEMARDEVMRPSPKWQAVRRMLTAIAAGVAGVASLTDAITNIQAIVNGIK